jgi:hypothetical protein
MVQRFPFTETVSLCKRKPRTINSRATFRRVAEGSGRSRYLVRKVVLMA